MVSVILPVYQVEKYVKECIQSVLGQSYRNFEVIVVDDGSMDNSARIAEALLYEDGTVPYKIIHTQNCGVSAARNTGLDYAMGEYVIMVDADDVVSPDFLLEYVRMISTEPESNIYSCGFMVVEEGQNRFADFSNQQEEICRLSEKQAQIAFLDRKIRFLLPTLMLRRDFLCDHGIRFDEAVRYSEDVQFIWRCLAYNTKPVIHNSKEVYRYILHSGSTMTASSVSKIITCCGGIQRLYEQTGHLYCDLVQEQLVPRTFFSMLHGAAKMMDYVTFCKLYDTAECKPHIVSQAKCGELRIELTSKVLLLSKLVGYVVMRKF